MGVPEENTDHIQPKFFFKCLKMPPKKPTVTGTNNKLKTGATTTAAKKPVGKATSTTTGSKQASTGVNKQSTGKGQNAGGGGGKDTKKDQGNTSAGGKNEEKKEPVKKWTKEDEAARTIQCSARQHIARKELNRLKKEKLDYEETMERLEKEAFVALVRMEQEKLRKEQEKEDEERRRRLEEKKRIGRMLEAAFEGDNFAIKTILREIEELDDEAGVVREGYGLFIRKRHQLAMVDCKDANDNTPLSEAAAGGHQDTITMLVEKGADVNSRGQFERTPLYRAAFAGNMAAAQVLLSQGADPRLYANDGMQPVHIAASDSMKGLLEEWDIEMTERILERLEAEKERRRQEDRNTCNTQSNKLENEVEKAKKIYQACQKQLENSMCELNRRIYEHDKCVRKMQNKSEITLKAIEDAQTTVDERQLEADKAKERLDAAKVTLREQKRQVAVERRESLLEMEMLPGEKVTVKELDDVLLRDVGNKLKTNPKWPLIIDIKGQASTFLRYRDTNFLLALSPQDMETESLRMALLGALRYGKPFVIDMMQVEMWDTVCDRMNEISSNLSQMLTDKSLLTNENFKCLIKEGDSKEYKSTNFSEDKLENFKFFLLTKLSQPSDSLLDKFHPIRVHIPGADAFADID
ncbi:IQ motif and ankyrin repeat domain-containing protein 1-like isoform X2 [Convolutriloba macropyga]|uniref:IQ motif and ankyrin repeat domain-containing protein 1-like isoform X2 n=1 Tax=Convolutriloba macropyga TaxID=536237 RepID=UPI003F524D99